MIFALVASLLAAVSIGRLSKHMPTSGSFYTYVSNGLHPALGFLVGWGFLLGILVGGPPVSQSGAAACQTVACTWSATSEGASGASIGGHLVLVGQQTQRHLQVCVVW